MLTGQAIISSGSAVLRRDLDQGGSRLPLSCLTAAQRLTPCFLNCCQSTSEPLFCVRYVLTAVAQPAFEVAPDAFNLTRLADISSSGGSQGQEQV